MDFLNSNPSPIFLKVKRLDDELDFYERKIRLLENEFAGNLKQVDAAILLEWIAIRQRLRMRN